MTENFNPYAPPKSDIQHTHSLQTSYPITFGSAFTVDQFGFVRKGIIHLNHDSFCYEGKKSWHPLIKFAIFLCLTVIPLVLFGMALGLLLTLIVLQYFCVSDSTLTIQRHGIQNVVRKKKQLRFKANHPTTGKPKKTVFNLKTEDDAIALEKWLLATPN